MPVDSGTIEVKHVDVSPPFEVELGVIAVIILSIVFFKLLWG